MPKVFVYGTLRPKGRKATHTLSGYAMMNAGPYPYIIPSTHDTDHVYGNVITVTDKELQDMDRYEGVNRGLYTREKVTVYAGHNSEYVYAYVAGPDFPRPVPSGDWYER